MKLLAGKSAFALVFLFTLTLLAAESFAQCGNSFPTAKLKPQAWSGNVSAGSLLTISDRDDHDNDAEGIVGMWSFSFIVDGHTVDHGFAQWHSDGTEITNSNRKPSTGSFCLGVWKKAGPRHYVLNHFALGFDDGEHLGYNNIREDVIVSPDGQSFSGSVSFSFYDADGNPAGMVTGEVTGKRVTIHTTVPDTI